MIIIYYRDVDADGKITRAHTPPEDWTLEETQERINQYNSEHGHRSTVHALQVEDGSIEAYLYQRANERAKWDREALQEAISAIEDALDTVRGLEC